MKNFSMPADFKKETLEKYNNLNNKYDNAKIYETYGQITINNYFESGRSFNVLPLVNLEELRDYIYYSDKYNINFNYTLNALNINNKEFTKDGIIEINNFLEQLDNIGVRWLTITLPSLIEIINNSKYKFNIKASTICQITSPNKSIAYKKLGVQRIVLDESINRNFFVIKKIVESFGENIDLIINPICNKDCIYRMFHYNQISSDSIRITNESSINYYSNRCALRWYNDISSLLRISWIRPEDLNYYSKIGIKYFKIQGRHTVLKGDPVSTAESYMKESFDGNLMDLLTMHSNFNPFPLFVNNKSLNEFVKPFFEIENFCKNNCDNCKYCDSFVNKCIDYKKSQKILDLARNFYNDNDQFNNLLKSINDHGNNTVCVNFNFDDNSK